nr:MAG TPA: hypothetical protein [Bacteriophage sp.]DAH37506.1 MAG TPA: hypothetical protein [Caudoviricetes sp.]
MSYAAFIDESHSSLEYVCSFLLASSYLSCCMVFRIYSILDLPFIASFANNYP